ncbi:hypothetical protein JXQ31_14875 [candidate division KSB1 bacterium]|nr:hypothetical protein [candidate division KSB1 bacterium]
MVERFGICSESTTIKLFIYAHRWNTRDSVDVRLDTGRKQPYSTTG